MESHLESHLVCDCDVIELHNNSPLTQTHVPSRSLIVNLFHILFFFLSFHLLSLLLQQHHLSIDRYRILPLLGRGFSINIMAYYEENGGGWDGMLQSDKTVETSKKTSTTVDRQLTWLPFFLSLATIDYGRERSASPGKGERSASPEKGERSASPEKGERSPNGWGGGWSGENR